jgi:multiple sugar transport system substrate-binding protein
MPLSGGSRSFTRRSLLTTGLGLTGLAAAAAVAACAAPAPTPTAVPAAAPAAAAKPTAAAPAPAAAAPAAAGQVSLRLSVRQAAEGTKTEAGIAAFEAKNPSIKVKLETYPGDKYQEKILTLGAGGDLPDVTYAHVGFIHQTSAGGFWADLDPPIKQNNFDLTPFFKTDLDFLRMEGKLFSLPYKGHSGNSAIWYNKQLVEKEKVDPATIKDYDALTQAGKQLTASTKGTGQTDQWGYLNPGYDGWALMGHFRAFGGDPVTPSLGANKAGLDQPQQVAAITWLHDSLHKWKICPLPGGQGYGQIFIAGAAAMRNGGLFNSGDQAAIGDRFTQVAVSMPKGPTGKVGLWHNFDQMALSAKTRTPNEAWKCLEYFCSKEMGIRLGLSEGGGASTPGLRRDVYGSDELKKAVPPIDMFLQQLLEGDAMWYAANFQTGVLWTTIGQALDKIILNPTPPTAADFKAANAIVQAKLDEPRL